MAICIALPVIIVNSTFSPPSSLTYEWWDISYYSNQITDRKEGHKGTKIVSGHMAQVPATNGIQLLSTVIKPFTAYLLLIQDCN